VARTDLTSIKPLDGAKLGNRIMMLSAALLGIGYIRTIKLNQLVRVIPRVVGLLGFIIGASLSLGQYLVIGRRDT